MMTVNERVRPGLEEGGSLEGAGLPKRRHRLGLTGAFVVWLIVFAGMVAYLAAH